MKTEPIKPKNPSLYSLYGKLGKEIMGERREEKDVLNLSFTEKEVDSALLGQGISEENLQAARDYAVDSGWISRFSDKKYSLTKKALEQYHLYLTLVYVSSTFPY